MTPRPGAGRGRPPDAIAPDGSEIRYLELGALRASLVEASLASGRISRPVRHRSVEEIWHVLAGEGRIWLMDAGGREQIRRLAPGVTLVIPTGSAFQFAAAEEAELRLLCYTSPPWPGGDEAEPVSRGGLGPPRLL